jgi:ribosomal protein L10
MNEQAINDAYSLFSSKGYNGSVEDFKNLIATNPNALDDAYKLFASKGYNGSIDGFSELMGLKKKEPSVSTSQEGAMAPATEAGSLASQESAPVLDFTKLRQEQQAQQFGELPAQPQAEPAMPPSPQLQQQVMGRMASPKSKTVETTRADGTPVTIEFGPTEFKSSDEAPMPQFKTFSEMAGQVDATIDEPTKQKISQAIGITGAVFNKIVSPNASVPEAINQAKAFADNTQAAYNVGVLSGQISNNMQQSVPDKERIAKLNKELKQEQTKLLSSQMGADASDFFDMLASNPVTFLTEVLTTSAAQMATGVGGMRPEDLAAAGALTLATGIGGTAYMSGRNSLNAEMSSRIMGALEERGVDITDAAQLETAMTNRDLMMEIAGEVQAPATFVAALDALSAGMAGKLGKPIYEVLAQSLAGSSR